MFPSAAFPPLSALHRPFFSALASAPEPYIKTSDLAWSVFPFCTNPTTHGRGGIMRVNKLIRLWVHGGRGGIHDASPPVKRTGVMNAASTTTVSILLTFMITQISEAALIEKNVEEVPWTTSQTALGLVATLVPWILFILATNSITGTRTTSNAPLLP